MSVDLRLMSYVVAVAEEGGFQDAASRLHVAQSALSRHVSQFERELGFDLFDRRPTRITEPGQVFVDNARRILADVERLVEQTRLVARGEVGLVRIGSTITAAFDAVPCLVDTLYRDHPTIEVETGHRWEAELVDDLERGDFDLVLGYHLTGLPGLRSAVIRQEALAAVVAREHPLAGRPGLRLDELRGETFRFLPRRLAPRYFDLVVTAVQSTGAAFDVRQSADPRLGSFAVDDLGGFTVMPASVGGRLPKGVTCVPIADPLPTIDLDVVWRAEVASPSTQTAVRAAHRLAGGSGVPVTGHPRADHPHA